jgi:Ran GTPase-activating protein (RanGAP) involved in mRNA processing and transport
MATPHHLPGEMPTLDIRAERGVLEAAHASTLVHHVTSGARRDYRRVILSNWAFTEEAAAVFRDALASLPHLESAILADIIAGRMEAEGLAVYRVLGQALATKQLLEIDMSDNAVGPKGLEACAEFLTNQARLQRLFFCNCGISAEAARTIADLVLFRTPTALHTLHFYNNMSGNGGAIAIADMVAASPQLRDFRFSSSRGGNAGGIALAKALRAAPGIQRIDVNDNMFGVPGSSALAQSLRFATALTHLNVGDIGMGDEGLAALASALVRGPAHTLQELNVSANEITTAGAKPLARLVRRLTRLRVLRAEENELENEGARYIARAIERRHGFRAKAGVPAGEPDSLEEVNLAENMVRNHGGLALATAAAAHLPRLKLLRLSGNDLTTGGVERVRAALATAGLEAALASMDDEEGGDDASDEQEDEEEEEAEEEPLDADAEESDEGEEAAPAGGAGADNDERPDKDVDAMAAEMQTKFEI